ncbi:MAG: transcription antitermination factor NusB [Candidatus Fraserbacteria bacterium RBG_16_55_9]|uniref:Transcription antitermination protein NusB n=1 Tax=Fraserbacteria sp. (strain RBG_16_55_9) TaxID=1817864 RepID=A0A1F5URT2_FRAXR|nr:MAG: transcription antitermination factor NusB [Candidatus Fraserbacteria bacterium RBG_16_55_9]
MKRRQARELILKILFQKDFVTHTEGLDNVRDPYARAVLIGIQAHQDEIDRRIQERAQGWRLERLHSVDRNVLRLAIYELLYRDDVPPEVIIDEAVELAKKYGTEKSPAFINGILDRILKEERAPL